MRQRSGGIFLHHVEVRPDVAREISNSLNAASVSGSIKRQYSHAIQKRTSPILHAVDTTTMPDTHKHNGSYAVKSHQSSPQKELHSMWPLKPPIVRHQTHSLSTPFDTYQGKIELMSALTPSHLQQKSMAASALPQKLDMTTLPSLQLPIDRATAKQSSHAAAPVKAMQPTHTSIFPSKGNKQKTDPQYPSHAKRRRLLSSSSPTAVFQEPDRTLVARRALIATTSPDSNALDHDDGIESPPDRFQRSPNLVEPTALLSLQPTETQISTALGPDALPHTVNPAIIFADNQGTESPEQARRSSIFPVPFDESSVLIRAESPRSIESITFGMQPFRLQSPTVVLHDTALTQDMLSLSADNPTTFDDHQNAEPSEYSVHLPSSASRAIGVVDAQLPTPPPKTSSRPVRTRNPQIFIEDVPVLSTSHSIPPPQTTVSLDGRVKGYLLGIVNSFHADTLNPYVNLFIAMYKTGMCVSFERVIFWLDVFKFYTQTKKCPIVTDFDALKFKSFNLFISHLKASDKARLQLIATKFVKTGFRGFENWINACKIDTQEALSFSTILANANLKENIWSGGKMTTAAKQLEVVPNPDVQQKPAVDHLHVSTKDESASKREVVVQPVTESSHMVLEQPVSPRTDPQEVSAVRSPLVRFQSAAGHVYTGAKRFLGWISGAASHSSAIESAPRTHSDCEQVKPIIAILQDNKRTDDLKNVNKAYQMGVLLSYDRLILYAYTHMFTPRFNSMIEQYFNGQEIINLKGTFLDKIDLKLLSVPAKNELKALLTHICTQIITQTGVLKIVEWAQPKNDENVDNVTHDLKETFDQLKQLANFKEECFQLVDGKCETTHI